MQVLVVNTGSSSLELRLLDDRDQVAKSADLPVRAPDVNDRDLTRTLRDWPPLRSAGLRVVTCHLGAGASLAAVVDGRSVDTTMGFTPLEGLVMAARSGTADPGSIGRSAAMEV